MLITIGLKADRVKIYPTTAIALAIDADKVVAQLIHVDNVGAERLSKYALLLSDCT